MPRSLSEYLSTLFHGAGIIFTGMCLQYTLSFLTRIVLARGLGPRNFGRLSIGISIVATTTTLVLLGMNTGISRFLPRMQTVSEKRSIVLSAIQIALPVALLSCVGVYLVSGWLATEVFNDPSLRGIIRIFAFCIPLFTLLKLTVGGIRGLEKAVPRVMVENIAFPGGRLLFTGTALLLGAATTDVALGYLSAYALGGIAGLYYLCTQLPLFRGIEKSMHSTLLSFSAPLVITAAMATVIADADTFIIAYFSSSENVGIYNVVYPLAALVSVFLSSFGYLFMPIISELHSANEFEQISTIYAVATKWVFLVTTPVIMLFVMFGEDILSLAFGSEYISGTYAFSILTIGFGTHAIFGPNRDTLTSIGQTRWIMSSNIGIALFNIAVNITLIPQFGIEGAAVATAVSYTLLNCLYSYRLYQDTGINPFGRQFTTHLLTAILVGVCFIIARYWFAPYSLPGIITTYVLYLGAYTITISYVGILNDEEISTLSKFADESDSRLGQMLRKFRLLD